VVRLAGRQHGVVTAAQARAAGLSADAVRHRVRAGWLVRLHRGVYRIGPLGTRWTAQMAALLAAGDSAALSHWSAAEVWGLIATPPEAIHLTTTRAGATSRSGLRLHRTHSLRAAVHDGLRLITPVRTLQDIATRTRGHTLERAVEEAQIRRLTTEAELRATRGAGAGALQAAIPHEAGFTRSEAERALLRLIRQARLPPPRTNVRVAGHEVDAHWPDHPLVVEIDGYAYHRTRRAFERDRARDADLARAGHRTLRLTYRRLTAHPHEAVATLASLLTATPP